MLCTASANFKKMNNNYHNLGGTIRAKKAGETYRRILPIAEKIGVTRVANVTGLDYLGIPVAIAIRPDSQHLSVSQGKGSSILLAKVSALMESIELWHAENLPPPGIKNTSYAEQAANRIKLSSCARASVRIEIVPPAYQFVNIRKVPISGMKGASPSVEAYRCVFLPCVSALSRLID